MRSPIRAAVLVAVLFAATSARASPTEGPAPNRSPSELQFGLPFVAGLAVITRADGTRIVAGPSIALRPVFTLPTRARDRPRPALYGELASNGFLRGRGPILGAGFELVVPFGDHGAITPSVGSFRRFGVDDERGVSTGLFFGTRERGASLLDASSGLRIDARIGVGPDADRAIVIGLSGDLVAGVGMLGWML